MTCSGDLFPNVVICGDFYGKAVNVLKSKYDVVLCEYPRWDLGSHMACKYMGYNRCKLLDKPIHQDIMGWKTCHIDCPDPYCKLSGSEYLKP